MPVTQFDGFEIPKELKAKRAPGVQHYMDVPMLKQGFGKYNADINDDPLDIRITMTSKTAEHAAESAARHAQIGEFICVIDHSKESGGHGFATYWKKVNNSVLRNVTRATKAQYDKAVDAARKAYKAEKDAKKKVESTTVIHPKRNADAKSSRDRINQDALEDSQPDPTDAASTPPDPAGGIVEGDDVDMDDEDKIKMTVAGIEVLAAPPKHDDLKARILRIFRRAGVPVGNRLAVNIKKASGGGYRMSIASNHTEISYSRLMTLRTLFVRAFKAKSFSISPYTVHGRPQIAYNVHVIENLQPIAPKPEKAKNEKLPNKRKRKVLAQEAFNRISAVQGKRNAISQDVS